MLSLRRMQLDDEAPFLEAVARSVALHQPWVSPPATSAAFQDRLSKYDGRWNVSYLALAPSGDLVACINVTEIVRGSFQSAYLGYYVFAPFDGKGLMKQAMKLVISEAFGPLGLHRLEANIQPANERSLGLVRSLGFRREGFSPRYLKVGDAWCDHERYALTAEEWTG